MIPRTLVRDLRPHVGQQVTVYGWVNTLRLQRKIQLVLVRDHTGVVQVTHKRVDGGSASEDLIEHGIPIESAVKVTGTVMDNPVVNLGGPGIIPDAIGVVSRADSPLPIDDQAGIDQRLDWRFLDLRNPAGTAALVGDRLGKAVLMRRRRRVPPVRSGFAGFRFPREVIVLAVCWSPRSGIWWPPAGSSPARCSARVISAEHAFIQNVRRGHYELGVDEPTTLWVAAAFEELALAI